MINFTDEELNFILYTMSITIADICYPEETRSIIKKVRDELYERQFD